MLKLTNEQIWLIKSSWTHVIAYSDKAGDLFYRHFFALAPPAQDLFKDNLEIQNRKLLAAISLIVAKLPKIEHIEEELHSLSQRHRKYGVRPEYFEAFGKAFMNMLAEVMGEAWSDEMREIWEQVYQTMSEAIIKDMKHSETDI
ncbi:MAG: globin domain-containing protein [Microscillaceae bacterium]|jgi:hemoglobin-like flavoprotein|nr:globin domain-containing protein [Microscillaceae bacterium]